MNKHLHNIYIVIANLLLYVLEYEQVYKDNQNNKIKD